MATTTSDKTEALTPRKLARRVGQARLEAEEAKRLLAEAQERLTELEAGSRKLEHLLKLLREARETLARLDDALPRQLGVSVGQAAERLQVSQPTVRKWVRDGYLRALPEVKPAEISTESVLEMHAVLRRVCQAADEREPARALAAYLHDRAILDSGDFQRAFEDARAGRVVTLGE